MTINSDTALTISNTNPKTVTNDRIVIGNNVNASLTFNGVNISAPTDQSAIYVPSGSSLKITLADDSTNSTIGGNGSTGSAAPAIRLPDGATLTIEGTGTLNVTGGSSTGNPGGTGIGGYLYYAGPSPTAESCGTVIILSGTVTVTGGSYSAGIGGATNHAGTGGNGGTVVILSSSVTVTGGSSAVAIGGGNSSGSSRGNDGQGIKPTGDGTYTVRPRGKGGKPQSRSTAPAGRSPAGRQPSPGARFAPNSAPGHKPKNNQQKENATWKTGKKKK